MEYIIRESGALVDYQGLREARPNNYIPPAPDESYLDQLGVDQVVEVIAPPVTILQVAVRDGAEKVGNVWRYKWVINSLPGPTGAAHLKAMQDAKWELIKAERDRRKGRGVQVAGKWFHTDTESRIQHIGLFIMGANVPAVPWKTMDGSFINMSQSIAAAIFQSVALLDQMAFSKAEEHRLAMMAMPDPTNYDFSQGWPAVFGG